MLLFPGRPTNVLDERDCPDADEKFVRHVFYGNTAEKRGLDVFDAIALEILDEIAHFPNLAIPRMPFGRNRYAAVGYLHSLSRLPRSPIHVYRCFYSHWADGRRAIEDGEGKTIGSSIPYRKPSVLVFRVHYYPLTENIWRAAAKAINLLLAPKKPLEFHSPPGADESELVSELAGDAQDPQQFGGGKIVFFQDRVELCGVDICSGPRCQSKRQILDCLRKKLSDGSFIQYSSVPFATEANMDRGQTGHQGLYVTCATELLT